METTAGLSITNANAILARKPLEKKALALEGERVFQNLNLHSTAVDICTKG
jgi:hypothetical protein